MEKIRKSIFLYLVIFLVGGCLYSTMEIVFRQYTHISMFFAGGLCLSLITLIDRSTSRLNFLIKALLCGLAITAVELAFGIILNIIFKLGVWSYYGEPFNILGQICLPFSFMWVVISIPALLISRLLISIITENKGAELD